MKIPSKYMEDAVEQLSSLPGIGKRTALRLVIQLLNRKPEEIEGFANSFIAMKENVKHCKSCNNISDLDICTICSNPNRNHEIICVVEDVRDVMAIEETSSFKGVYHVLGGVISPMDGVGPNDLHIQSLVEKAQAQFDEAEAKKLEKKIRKNQFDFEDFLTQIQQIKKMGNLKDLMGMIPGVGKSIKDIDIKEDAFKGVESIIQSMTLIERRNPDILTPSRKARIAKGAGKDLAEINAFIKQFDQMKQMMKMMSGPAGAAMASKMPGMRR